MQCIDEVSLSTAVLKNSKDPDGKLLDVISEAGYNMIELTRKYQDPGVIRKSGLKVWSIHGYFEGPITGSDAELQKSIDIACRRVEMLGEFAPCPVVEHYLFRHNDPEIGRCFRKCVEKLYDFYSKLGFILCVETAPYKPKHNQRYPDSKEIAAFVRSFEKDDLRMTIDINHSNLHEDLEQVCDNCRGLISNIHVSDNMGEWEDHMPPGTGIIDLKRAFAALRRNGYAGPCNLEFVYSDSQEIPTAEKLRGVRKYVEQLLWEK